jgi:hypothetical protein
MNKTVTTEQNERAVEALLNIALDDRETTEDRITAASVVLNSAACDLDDEMADRLAAKIEEKFRRKDP